MSSASKLIILGFISLSIGTVLAQQNFCSPSPCGANTDCETKNGRPTCSCKPLFSGNPITGCKYECEKDEDCSSDKACTNYRCKSPCPQGCGDYATCEVRNHQAICQCPKQYGGDAYTKCIPECTSQQECPSHLACIDLHCGDPCRERPPCKSNTNCKVEKHTAICTCREGFVGHPLNSGCFRQ